MSQTRLHLPKLDVSVKIFEETVWPANQGTRARHAHCGWCEKIVGPILNPTSSRALRCGSCVCIARWLYRHGGRGPAPSLIARWLGIVVSYVAVVAIDQTVLGDQLLSMAPPRSLDKSDCWLLGLFFVTPVSEPSLICLPMIGTSKSCWLPYTFTLAPLEHMT